MKLPLDLECPVEGWERIKITETLKIPSNPVYEEPDLDYPVEVYAWKDKKGEIYLSGETCSYLDCVKANIMGLINCGICEQEASCDFRKVEQCITQARKQKGLLC